MKAKPILSIVLIISLTFSGCWDGRELSYMLIVSGIAIDKGEHDNIRLTLLAPLPKVKGSTESIGGSEASNEVFIVSEEGEDIIDAYRKISIKLSRQIFLSQTQVILVGEALASEGISDTLDFFTRHPETPMKIFILFTKGTASDLLKVKSKLEVDSLEEIKKLKYLNLGKKLQLKDFIYMITEEGIQPTAPLVQGISSEKEQTSSGSTVMSITGAAVFKEDKLIGWMNMKEYRGVMWIHNRIKTGGITVEIPEEKGGGTVSGQIVDANTKVVPVINGDDLEIKVNIFTQANISQSASKLDLSDRKIIHYVEGLFSEDIKKLVEASVNSVKDQFSSDVFGFGIVVHGKYPKQWDKSYKKNWDDNFYKLKISISSTVKINETGYDTKTITKKEEELLK
jgi:spore germination protein KC